jgi:hypothetical protein
MPVVGNLGQQGKKGAFEVLGITIKNPEDKEGLIEKVMPERKESEEKPADGEKSTKKEGEVKP